MDREKIVLELTKVELAALYMGMPSLVGADQYGLGAVTNDQSIAKPAYIRAFTKVAEAYGNADCFHILRGRK